MFQFLFLVVIITFALGCSQEQPLTSEPQIDNAPPIIDRVILPAQVDVNTPVKLQVIVRDPDRDKLEIVWEASAGTVEGEMWTTPNRGMQVDISVHVTDKNNPTVTQSKQVTVQVPQAAQKPKPVVDEIIPPPPAQPEPIRPQWTIVPNTGLLRVMQDGTEYSISLGQPFDDLIADPKFFSEGKEGENQFRFIHQHLRRMLLTFEDGKVVSISTTDDRFQTDQGIGVGSTKIEMIAAYGDPHWIQGENHRYAAYFRFNYFFAFENESERISIVGIVKL